MALDGRYITDTTPSLYLLISSLVFHWLAAWYISGRTTKKYAKTCLSALRRAPNYIYQALPNPMVLNNVGTFQNAGQDNVAVYYYPYDDNGEVELYYVEVFSAANLDVPQFVREAWPNVIGSSDPTNDGGNGGFTNQLSNPQFVDVLFNTTSGLDITYSGNTVTTQQIAPDWF